MKHSLKHYTDSINYELEKTARLMKILTVKLFDDLKLDISPDEFFTLDILSVNVGICQRDLAKLILKDRANTGRILNSLEQKKFIQRYIDTKNNRLVKKMQITEIGQNKLDTINETIENYLSNITRKLNPDDILKVKEVLKNFRLELENIAQIKI